MVKRNSLIKEPLIISAVLIAVLVYSGIVKVKNVFYINTLFNLKSIVRLEGELCSNPIKSSNGRFYNSQLKINKCYTKNGGFSSCNGKIKLLLPSEIVEAYMPGRLYSEIKYKNALICEQGYHICVDGFFSDKSLFIAKNGIQLDAPDSFMSKLKKIRALCRINFRRIMYSWGAAGGLLLALLSGIREYTEKEISEGFRLAGLSHILALSGMHLSLFQNLSKKAVNRIVKNKISVLIQLCSIYFFVWFAGISPSLFRALICSTTLIFCKLLSIKNVKMITILAFSFIVHVTVRPQDIFELAFLLSYGALAGILLFGNALSFFTISRLPVIFSNSIGASCGAQFFTAPIALRQTGVFSPIGIVSTFFVSPIVNLFIYSGLVLIILCFLFPVLVPYASFYMKILYNIIRYVISLFSRFPYFDLA